MTRHVCISPDPWEDKGQQPSEKARQLGHSIRKQLTYLRPGQGQAARHINLGNLDAEDKRGAVLCSVATSEASFLVLLRMRRAKHVLCTRKKGDQYASG